MSAREKKNEDRQIRPNMKHTQTRKIKNFSEIWIVFIITEKMKKERSVSEYYRHVYSTERRSKEGRKEKFGERH